MKKIVLFLGLGLTALTFNAQAQAVSEAKAPAQPAQTPPAAEQIVNFKNAEYDFGKIPQGKPVEYDLVMKNISKDSVKIERVQVSCGCTSPKYDQGKVYAPGQEFKVTLGYNAATEGHFEKYVTIFFGNGSSKVVKFKGETYKAPENAAPANAPVQKLKGGK